MKTSESVKNIAKALAQFQAEVKNPTNTANNPYFNSKYAPLDEVLNTVRPILSKHGLSVLQFPSGDGQNIIVTTVVMHESGEWIESDPLTLRADKATAQGAGSAITYARRYSLSAVLGISSEDDDDGNYATQQTKQAGKAQNKTQAISNKQTKQATDSQIGAIYAIMKKNKISDDEKIKGKVSSIVNRRISSMKELTKQEASKVIAMLNALA